MLFEACRSAATAGAFHYRVSAPVSCDRVVLIADYDFFFFLLFLVIFYPTPPVVRSNRRYVFARPPATSSEHRHTVTVCTAHSARGSRLTSSVTAGYACDDALGAHLTFLPERLPLSSSGFDPYPSPSGVLRFVSYVTDRRPREEHTKPGNLRRRDPRKGVLRWVN